MPIDQIDKVTIAVSADADHPVRTAVKGAEDEINRLVDDINSKAVFPDVDTGAIAAPGDISSTGDVTSGGKVTSTGDITSGAKVISTGDITAGANITGAGSLAAHTATPIPAGGATGAGVLVSSTPNFGLFFGSGAPAISAAKGALYMRSDGTTTNDRMYVNTDGATTWTAVNTVT
jgi:hypothetical protein